MSSAGQAYDAFPDFVIVPESEIRERRKIEASVAGVEKPEPSRPASPVLPLLALVVGLATAAAWFVGVPQLTKPAPIQRGCEVIVLQSGKTKCVPNPQARSARAKS